MAERVFVTKLNRVGFAEIEVRERFAFGLDQTAGYPLFTSDLVELMRRLLPPEKHGEVATSVVITAAKPG